MSHSPWCSTPGASSHAVPCILCYEYQLIIMPIKLLKSVPISFIFFLCPFSTYIGALAICSNGNLGVRQTGVASVCPLQLQFFNFRSAPYIQDCVVPPSALNQAKIWSFVPIQVAVESAILEREHPYSRPEIFQIGSLP